MNNKKDLNKLKRPQESFRDLVSEASLEKLKPYIQEMVRNLHISSMEEQTANLQGIFERLTAVEKLVIESSGISNEEYAEKVTDVQDEFYGLESKDDLKAEEGDVLRIEVSTKTKDQSEFAGTSRMMIQALGSGKAIGKELEKKLVGSMKGDEILSDFGEGMVARIQVNRVSRRRS